ncbi:MAG: lysine--tRNA ligase [Nitrospiraceae bacterium]|nr:lysine--tRNA ligase [Nitrospiraceae bacterium]
MSNESAVIKQRRQKAEQMEKDNVPLYPNGIKPSEKAEMIHTLYDSFDGEALKKIAHVFSLAGRIMSMRRFGKAAFLDLQDRSNHLQVYVQRDQVGTEAYALFKKFDIGDLIKVTGRLFRTKTGELTLFADTIKLVTKSMRPLPEKYHGIKDKEIRYRQRYVDLIMSEEVRKVFRDRSHIVQMVRRYLISRDFLEVETPMMQPIVGGATARPFRTHHNALDMDLYLRIAPELYLKRLLVGGCERVFELNRNFRNEGISVRHNPEFTMLEFYEAYATYTDLMTRTEEMFSMIADEIKEGPIFSYQGHVLNFTPPWRRMALEEALVEIGQVSEADLMDRESLMNRLKALDAPIKGDEKIGKFWTKLFDLLVEPRLIQPTFITKYPADVSPLARKSQGDPMFTDRFELFIAGQEIGNAFSELNDPREQRRRFEEQIANRGDDEEISPVLDEDYVRALEVGMPPAAGEGIGIDRLVMLFTDSPSIRDVILFPQLRPEA